MANTCTLSCFPGLAAKESTSPAPRSLFCIRATVHFGGGALAEGGIS